METALEENWGNARADVKRGGFSFVPGVSCWWDGQDVAGSAGGGGIAEAIGGIAWRQAAQRGDGAALCAVYAGEV